VIPKVSAEQLRAKTDKTMRGSAAAGHGKFLHEWGKEPRGKIIPAQVLPVLQGKGQERREAFLLTAVLVPFDKTKGTRPSRGHERAGVVISTKYFRNLQNMKQSDDAGVVTCFAKSFH
jgi:hypothetical protein